MAPGSSPPARGALAVLSPEAWDEAAPTNKHQLALRFARRRSVLYVDMSGRSLRERIWPPVLHRRLHGVHVLEVAALPERMQNRFAAVAGAQQLAAALVTRAAARAVAPGQLSCLAYFPFVPQALSALRPGLLVYHCVDHHASFPQYRHRHELSAHERWLVEHADLVIASSQALAAHCRQWRADVHYLPNVGDVELFAAADTGPRPPAAPDEPLTALFHGTFSSHKIDFAWLGELADADPRLQLHVLGRVVDHAEMDALLRRPNVTHLSQRRPPEVIPHLARADVLVLPYARSPHTEHVFPLKLTEYLATGKPIVATPLQSIAAFCGQAIRYADRGTEAAAVVREIAGEPAAARLARQALVSGRDWEARTNEIAALMEQAVLGEPRPTGSPRRRARHWPRAR